MSEASGWKDGTDDGWTTQDAGPSLCTRTGVDYFGQMLVKKGRFVVKRWGALVTFLDVRVIHSECQLWLYIYQNVYIYCVSSLSLSLSLSLVELHTNFLAFS